MTTAYDIVINASAGTVLQLGRELIEQKITDSAIETNGVHFMEAADITAKLRALKKAKANILLMGGDGTVAGAVAEFMDGGQGFGILPMGTMNLLARDLKIPLTIDGALKAYARGFKPVKIDVALVNDNPFLCCAAIGVMPEAAELREQNRGASPVVLIPQLAMFVFNELDPMKRRRLRVNMDGKQRFLQASALIISNNLFSEDEGGDDGFKKETLQGGKLGLYSIAPFTWWDKLRFLTLLRVGGWKKDSVVVERVARDAIVRTGRRIEKISLDGETMDLKTPLHFSIKRRSAAMLVPLPEEVGTT